MRTNRMQSEIYRTSSKALSQMKYYQPRIETNVNLRNRKDNNAGHTYPLWAPENWGSFTWLWKILRPDWFILTYRLNSNAKALYSPESSPTSSSTFQSWCLQVFPEKVIQKMTSILFSQILPPRNSQHAQPGPATPLQPPRAPPPPPPKKIINK